MFKRLLKILPQTIAFLFLAGFVAYAAWQEPPSAPPDGNVPAPINVGPDAQTKAGDFTVNGAIKTLKDMIVGSATIKSDGSVSTGLYAENSQKLGGYSASDVSNSGKVTGTITLGGSLFGGVCGGYGCASCICYENTTCSVQGKGFCNGTTAHGGTNAPANYTAYQPVCDSGETLTLVSTQGVNQSCGNVVSCPIRTYQCVKPSINFPGCGNGVSESGEVCDDGNQLNNIGNCSANCSKFNYFVSPIVNGVLIREDAGSASQYCKEKGFTAYTKLNSLYYQASYTSCNFSPPYAGCPLWSIWNGSSWQTTQYPSFNAISEIWCQ